MSYVQLVNKQFLSYGIMHYFAENHDIKFYRSGCMACKFFPFYLHVHMLMGGRVSLQHGYNPRFLSRGIDIILLSIYNSFSLNVGIFLFSKCRKSWLIEY